jgi:hypothetical protein
MDSFSDLFKKENSGQVVLAILFIVYLISGYKTPDSVAGFIDTIYGKIVVVLVALVLFSYVNPILGVIYIFVAYELLRRTSLVKTGIVKADNYMIEYTPSEEKREHQMMAMNPRVGLTLEEEVIATMAPAQKFNLNGDISTEYKPVVEKVTGASLYV